MALRLKILLSAILFSLKYRLILADVANTATNEGKTAEDKKALRYGFQNTHECKDFEKAFLCVSKCLDFGFDASRSDKNCKCTCFTVKDKAKYTVPGSSRIPKKFTAPTTIKPIWAQPQKSQLDLDDPINTNQTDNENARNEQGGDYGGEVIIHADETANSATQGAGKETLANNNEAITDANEIATDTGETTADAGKTTADAGETAADAGETTADAGETTADAGETAAGAD
ncbi:hypothetical protein O0L34_g14548 [Tuta absoluta]|nr:hypothetical protein O0L34_g14548 [Tuta absoluta]